MATRLRLDEEAVAALEPGEKELFVWDEEMPGFGVRVFPSGTRSWVVKGRVVGRDGKARNRRVSIGRCGEVSLENARSEAMRLLGEGEPGQESAPSEALSELEVPVGLSGGESDPSGAVSQPQEPVGQPGGDSAPSEAVPAPEEPVGQPVGESALPEAVSEPEEPVGQPGGDSAPSEAVPEPGEPVGQPGGDSAPSEAVPEPEEPVGQFGGDSAPPEGVPAPEEPVGQPVGESAPPEAVSEPEEASGMTDGESAPVARVELDEGEVMDGETGEILQVGAAADGEELEEEELDFDSWDGGRSGAREPEGAADTEEQEKLVGDVLDKAVGGELAGPRDRAKEGLDDGGEASVLEEGAPAGSSGGVPEVEAGDGGGRVERDERVSQAAGGDDTAGEDEVPGKEPPERAERVRGAVVGAAGAAMEVGRKLVGAGRAKREPDEAKNDGSDRLPGEGASVEVAPDRAEGTGAGVDDGGSSRDHEEVEDRLREAVESVKEERDVNGLSDRTVAGLAESVEGVRGMLERIEAWNNTMGPRMEAISGSVEIAAMDGRRGRRRRLASVAVVVVALLAGVVVGGGIQSRVQVLPQADPSLGWKDHVWEYYGQAFMSCFDRARKAETDRADCSIEVRAK